MRTIKTTKGTYKISDDRNLNDFLKALKKTKPPVKRAKASPRVFPPFVSGETSTRDYVKAYYVLNNLDALNQEIDAYIEGLFGALPTTPAPDQPIEDDTIEVIVCS